MGRLLKPVDLFIKAGFIGRIALKRVALNRENFGSCAVTFLKKGSVFRVKILQFFVTIDSDKFNARISKS